MLRNARACLACAIWLGSLALSSCSAEGQKGGEIGSSGAGGAPGGGATGSGAPGSGASTGTFLPTDGSGPGSEGSVGTPVTSPCGLLGCGPGQRCQMLEGGSVECVDNTCEELACAETEECRADPRGGNVCANVFCASDVDCVASDFCASGRCESDVCSANLSSCDGAAVRACASNGSGEEVAFSCGSSAYFPTECQENVPGQAACSCEDDWDCPAFTQCRVDRCVGTGFAPSCTLPPADFEETRPAVEIHWGGDSTTNDAAHDGAGDGRAAPWPSSSHVQATPIVANLDDDNGDGRIDELDFPEIVFVTYTAFQDDNTGVIRAIHGGGPNKGRDYFALCGPNQLWREGDPLPVPTSCNGGDGRSRSPVAVADLNGDGVPEIVQVTVNNGFRILDNTGRVLVDRPNQTSFSGGGLSASPSIANLDHRGLPELIFGSTVFMLGTDAAGALFVSAQLNPPAGTNGENDSAGPMSCVADLSADPGQEILAGPTLYRLPATIPQCAAPPCIGTLQVVWSGAAVNTATPLAANAGLCAVADVWGASAAAAPGPNNPPDGNPEAIFIANGNLMILNGATGALIHQRNLGGGPRGGAPNVDDFDGDGFLEIASALSAFYVVIDLQAPSAACPAWPGTLSRAVLAGQADNPNLGAGLGRNPGGAGAQQLPSGAVVGGACSENAECGAGATCNAQAGRCVCLHNGWQRASDDDSSRATSSSVFDFNGDGAAEVLYNDECEFRVFDGVTGSVLFAELSRSRTWTENPVVADVDNDGNAEVVTALNTERENRSCNDDPMGTILGPNGIRVWGDPQDTWVAARRIWNQQSYHVTNVTESGAVPLHAPESWREFNGLRFNTYRSQPRTFGAAPDLIVTAASIFSPDAQCGTLENALTISFEVANAGDVRVGPGVELRFSGEWNGAFVPLQGATGQPLSAALADGVDPGRSVIATASFNLADQPGQTSLPSRIRVSVDTGGAAGSAFGAERECIEDNNELELEVRPGESLPDLTLAVGAVVSNCGAGRVTVSMLAGNRGAAGVGGTVVQLFAGNPAQGGTLLAEQVIDVPIDPMSSVPIDVEIAGFPRNRQITIYGVIDPANTIAECNESDNTDPADNAVFCQDLR